MYRLIQKPLTLTLKGHGRNVSAYLRESINSVGVVKSTCIRVCCRLKHFYLKYHTVVINIDYRVNIRTLTS